MLKKKSTCPDEVEVLPAQMRDAEDGRESGFIQPLRLGVASQSLRMRSVLEEKKSNSCT